MILDPPNLQQICNTTLTLVVHSCDNLGRGICNIRPHSQKTRCATVGVIRRDFIVLVLLSKE